MREAQKPRGRRPLTQRQKAFAEQVARGEMSALEIFREVYPSRAGRKKSTERTEVYRLMQTRSMKKAIDECKTRQALADPHAQIEIAKQIIHGIAIGEIDARRYRAAAAMLRLAQKQARTAEREQLQSERKALETALAEIAAIDSIQNVVSLEAPLASMSAIDRDENLSAESALHAHEIVSVVAARQQKRDLPAAEELSKQRRGFVNFGNPRLAGDWDLPPIRPRQRRESRPYY